MSCVYMPCCAHTGDDLNCWVGNADQCGTSLQRCKTIADVEPDGGVVGTPSPQTTCGQQPPPPPQNGDAGPGVAGDAGGACAVPCGDAGACCQAGWKCCPTWPGPHCVAILTDPNSCGDCQGVCTCGNDPQGPGFCCGGICRTQGNFHGSTNDVFCNQTQAQIGVTCLQ
jgi:hypothetical protein